MLIFAGCRMRVSDDAQHLHGEEAERLIGSAAQSPCMPYFATSHAGPTELEHDHDLAEHLAALQPRQAAWQIGKA